MQLATINDLGNEHTNAYELIGHFAEFLQTAPGRNVL